MKPIFFFLLFNSIVFAQEYLIQVDDKKIYTENIKNEYLKSFELFGVDATLNNIIDKELLIKEAKKQKLEQLPEVKKAMENYLASNIYKALSLEDKKNEVLQEVKNRIDKDLLVSVVGVTIESPYEQKDSLEAKNLLTKIKLDYEKTKDIDKTLKKINPKNTTVEQVKISHFKYPYEFEKNTYEVKEVGGTTDVFELNNKIAFGILLKEYKQKGEYQIKQIIITDSTNTKKPLIDEAYKDLTENKIPFDSVFVKYTKDSLLLKNKGTTAVVKSADLSYQILNELENIKPNEVTKPFKSPYGWHIIQVVNFIPIDLKNNSLIEELESQVNEGFGKQYLEKELIKKAKQNFKIIENEKNIKSFKKIAEDSYQSNKNIELEELKNEDQLIYSSKNDTVATFTQFAYQWNLKQKNPQFPFEVFFKRFCDEMLNLAYIDYAISHASDFNPSYKKAHQDHLDNVLYQSILAELVKSSKNDKELQQKYYNEKKGNFSQDTRGEGIVYKCEDKEMANKILNALNDEEKLNSITKQYAAKISPKNKFYLEIYSGEFNLSNSLLPKGTKLEKGVQEIEFNNYFYIVNFKNILKKSIMKFQKAIPYIIQEYGVYYVEHKINELKKKSKIEFNTPAINSLKNQYKK